MPMTSVKAAKEWQAAHRPNAGNRGATREATKPLEFQLQVPLVEADGETLR